MELCISNFRSIKEKNIIFENLCYLLDGESGSGKSTILDSIVWCLYGGIGNVYPFDHKISKQTVKVSVKIKNLTITRTKPPENIIILFDEKEYHGSEAQNIINKIFYGKNLFLSMSYLQQDDRNKFLTLTNQEKETMLKEIVFGGDKYETLLDSIDLFLKKMEEKSLVLSEKFKTSEFYIKKYLEDNREDIEKIKKTKLMDEEYYASLEKKIKEIKEGEENRKELEKINFELETFVFTDPSTLKKYIKYFEIKKELSNLEYYEVEGEYDTIHKNIIILENDLTSLLKSKEICKKLNIDYESLDVAEIIKSKINYENKLSEYEKYLKNKNIFLELTEKLKSLGEEVNIEHDENFLSVKKFYCPSCKSCCYVEDKKLKLFPNVTEEKEEEIKNLILKKKEIFEIKKKLKNLNFIDINLLPPKKDYNYEILPKIKNIKKINSDEKKLSSEISFLKEKLEKIKMRDRYNFLKEEISILPVFELSEKNTDLEKLKFLLERKKSLKVKSPEDYHLLETELQNRRLIKIKSEVLEYKRLYKTDKEKLDLCLKKLDLTKRIKKIVSNIINRIV